MQPVRAQQGGHTRLTAAGRQFQKHAAILVRTVERARQDVGIAAGYQGTLAVGGRFGLWEGLLLEWLPLMRKMAPDISVRAEIGSEEDLMQGLVEGRINIGVMYTPQSRPSLRPSFGCPPMQFTRTSLGPMPWVWRLGRCGK